MRSTGVNTYMESTELFDSEIRISQLPSGISEQILIMDETAHMQQPQSTYQPPEPRTGSISKGHRTSYQWY
jgi:hypothetical protein